MPCSYLSPLVRAVKHRRYAIPSRRQIFHIFYCALASIGALPEERSHTSAHSYERQDAMSAAD